MIHLLIVTGKGQTPAEFQGSLARTGLAYSAVSYDDAVATIIRQPPDMVLVETDGGSADPRPWEIIRETKEAGHVPVIALVPGEMLDSVNGHLDMPDDFVASPGNNAELFLRIKRLLHRNGNTDSRELIKCHGLVIDLARCEVIIEGKPVELTFKEYELLKLLAANPGRVYTREALLDKIWGYDYYGGDRTVDVHVRRLRSKIDDTRYNFIETVRNIGYKFRKGV